MHKIALEPKDPYDLWADHSGAGIIDGEQERCHHTGALLVDLQEARKVLEHSSRTVGG